MGGPGIQQHKPFSEIKFCPNFCFSVGKYAGLIGFGIGGGLAWLISLFLPFRAVIGVGSFLLAFCVSTFVGILFGILPAKNAANKNLIDILR
ncbi:ABC transporter permease [Heyndrickxia coagulans]|uniref:Uncharacterized protein n=1 Tax=Heyndrickxia coagulans TaxID=1398 RepID=A0AAW7CFF6_HEYCO|nr:hypothetical protein [Heyndrickxia coagulans]MDL5042229.1 hypothetical protein [Heyndrickxia coagulans]